MGKPGPYATAHERREYYRSEEGGGRSFYTAADIVFREDLIADIDRCDDLYQLKDLLIRLVPRIQLKDCRYV